VTSRLSSTRFTLSRNRRASSMDTYLDTTLALRRLCSLATSTYQLRHGFSSKASVSSARVCASRVATWASPSPPFAPRQRDITIICACRTRPRATSAFPCTAPEDRTSVVTAETSMSNALPRGADAKPIETVLLGLFQVLNDDVIRRTERAVVG